MTPDTHGTNTLSVESASAPIDAARVTADLERWIQRAVIGLNLCPFAADPVRGGRLDIVVSRATGAEALLGDLEHELTRLRDTAPQTLETTLLAHPGVLHDFNEFVEFLPLADLALQQLGLRGTLQIASFHPAYQFAHSEPDAIDNYTNRAPVPCLHLLREASVATATASLRDPDAIYRRNIDTLRRLGVAGWERLWTPSATE